MTLEQPTKYYIFYYGLNPSLANPSLTFRGSNAKSGCSESKVFQASEYAGCLNFPSLGRPFSCHFIESTIFDDIYNFLILGLRGKYLNTLARTGGEITLQETFFLRFRHTLSLYLEAPQLGHVSSFSCSFQNKIQSLGQAWIFS